MALLDKHADDLDTAVDELGRWIDHLRQVGIRGFIAAHTNDDDCIRPGPGDDETAPSSTADQAARGGTRRQRSKKKSGKK